MFCGHFPPVWTADCFHGGKIGKSLLSQRLPAFLVEISSHKGLTCVWLWALVLQLNCCFINEYSYKRSSNACTSLVDYQHVRVGEVESRALDLDVF
ncbi:hypothetical protein J6590_005048 [Homalodisca vitripennis]|nr:hypothetical protein J6590_005048 [Homalodisca vitripennis]